MKLRTLKNNFIYAIVLAPFLVGCQNDEFKKELENQKDEFNIIDLEKNYNGVNLETLLNQFDNIKFVNGSDTLCLGKNIIELFNFESTDESGQTFRTFSSKEEKTPLVITFNSDGMFASGFFKDKACKVAISNKPMTESLNALKSMPTVKNSSLTKLDENSSETALFVISTHSTEHSNASLSSPAVSDDPIKLLGNNSTSTLSNEPYTGDLMDYIRGDKTTYSPSSIAAGYQGNVFGTRGPNGNASYVNYYLKKTGDSNTNVFPTPEQDNTQWEFLGPYKWSYSRTGKVGSIYIYENPFNGKTELFRLKTTYYRGFSTNRTSNEYWEFLGDLPARSITVKLFKQSANLPIPHEIGWAWNSLINSMNNYVTNKITFIRADQDSIYIGGSGTNAILWSFNTYLMGRFHQPEPYTIYGLINHGLGDDGGAANTYSATNYTPTNNWISTSFPLFWSTTALGNTGIAHEVSTLLGARDHNSIFYEKWWWIFGIWYRDIMSTRSIGFIRYDRHKNEANINTMRHNLMVN
eukprot:GHVL01001762.1.p1 GENE.GHVL01001762.1~~GHVL01001762.1.p1  ORF type:complete len:523 (+),score=59.30 GHVL01001762.1:71-1639(+)